MRVGYALAIIISFPTSASGIIVLLKTPTKYRKFLPTLFVKTTDFQLVFNFERTRTVTIFGNYGIIALVQWSLPIIIVFLLTQDDPIMTEEEAVRLLSLAATIIQAHVRGYLVRKKFNFCQFRRRKHAAACIQAAW